MNATHKWFPYGTPLSPYTVGRAEAKASGHPRLFDAFPQISGELVEANSITMAGFPSPDYLDCSLFSPEELGSEALSFLPWGQAGSLLECGGTL